MEKRPSAEPQMGEKPGSASDHNNSMITAVSVDRDTEKSSSPATSPMIHRKETIYDSNGAGGPSHNEGRDADARFDNVVSTKSKELVTLMKEIVLIAELKDNNLQTFVNEQENGIKDKKFDWKSLVELSESIFNDYSKEMENITKEFDELNKEFLIWQESAYILDSEKVAKRLGNQEEWINLKETYLNYTRNELVKSAELIDNAIKSLRFEGNKPEKLSN